MTEKKITVLLADDEEDIKTIVKMFLESKGYEVITAFDGLDAIDKAKQLVPDMIFMDIMMPVIDGIEVTRQLKASEETKNIPIVMLTAAAKSQMVDKAIAAGAVEYIAKPFDPDALLKTVVRILGL
jgi:CheY-like chemotaxis protein